MEVFYLTVKVYGINFKTAVCGKKSDYTNEQLAEIRRNFVARIEEELNKLGYVG